ncbi:uncharacterized protein LOC115890807 [Sitophilus oryzae]|uniref:Uncharacterized protein LOC115890807 n=1 Tax=Sitophilus oryzae TaxID=7048 RepID=A0A6J2YV03_SITOR|nr:uncharacterized protein LOC115890807 [Sitophilus oryzae]
MSEPFAPSESDYQPSERFDSIDSEKELSHLNNAFLANGYNEKEIKAALAPRQRRLDINEQNNTVNKAFLPYVSQVTDRIGKVLRKHNIKTIYKPTRKIKDCLRPAKDKRVPLSSAGIYRIPCSCGSVYIGTTKRSVGTRLTEHKRSCRLGQTDKSAVAEHALRDGDHKIQFEDTQVIAQHLDIILVWSGKLLKFTNIQIISTGRKKLST